MKIIEGGVTAAKGFEAAATAAGGDARYDDNDPSRQKSRRAARRARSRRLNACRITRSAARRRRTAGPAGR